MSSSSRALAIGQASTVSDLRSDASSAAAKETESALDEILSGFSKLGDTGLQRVLPSLRAAALEVGNAVRAELLERVLEGVDLRSSSEEAEIPVAAIKDEPPSPLQSPRSPYEFVQEASKRRRKK